MKYNVYQIIMYCLASWSRDEHSAQDSGGVGFEFWMFGKGSLHAFLKPIYMQNEYPSIESEGSF